MNCPICGSIVLKKGNTYCSRKCIGAIISRAKQNQTPEQIVATAIQEDVQAIGLSILSGAHMTLFSRVIELLAENGASNIVLFGGGIIPEADCKKLLEMGVGQIFTPGAPTQEIVDWLSGALKINA